MKVAQQAFKIYQQAVKPYESNFLNKIKIPKLLSIFKYLFIIGKIACSAVCFIHGIPVTF